MRIFPGEVGDAAGQVAAAWVLDESLTNGDGVVRPEFVWAALDCPGYFAAEDKAGLALLGRMAATIKRPVHAGERLIVTGWPIESEGRKHRAVLVLGLEDAVDFGDQILEVEGLGQHLRLGRGAAALQGDGGKAGDEHHADRRVDRRRLLRQLDPVHLGHDDVGQQQVELLVLQKGHGLGAAADRLDLIADALQRPLQIFAHRRIVCAHDLKYSRH
jgi:hypothetical protein